MNPPRITILLSVVLGIVLCVSSAGTLAQEQDYEAFVKVLAAGDPYLEALAMHRLTVQNVRQMFAVDRELLELMKMVPDLETRISELRRRFDPQGRAGSAAVDVDAKVYEAIPEIAQILQRQKISGREYRLTKMAGRRRDVGRGLPPEVLQSDEGRELARDIMTPALKFWKSMPPPLRPKQTNGRQHRDSPIEAAEASCDDTPKDADIRPDPTRLRRGLTRRSNCQYASAVSVTLSKHRARRSAGVIQN